MEILAESEHYYIQKDSEEAVLYLKEGSNGLLVLVISMVIHLMHILIPKKGSVLLSVAESSNTILKNHLTSILMIL